MPNRLAAEASPYLRQHADNPVDWYPWGEQAFARARDAVRPVLLSVGYAACHWCHVMAEESFEDAQIAAAINAAFVPVKVDREEHPEVDAIYQRICQLVTGQGGWPLTVVLTPELRPFYVGTYLPPRSRHGRAGLADVLGVLARAWEGDRPRILEIARAWTQALERAGRAPAGAAAPPGRARLAAAAAALSADLDPLHGGFGTAPKFPSSEALEVLLRAGGRFAAGAVFTLRAMAGGGIYDHLGGGFHRYSVDAAWRVPHFEKMLYDNALLPPVYLAAHQRTGDADLAGVARQTLDYLLRELRAPEGGFFSTEDADSPGADGRAAEGAFYTWTPGEVAAAVGGGAAAEQACRHFGVTEQGNCGDGRTVLHLDAMSLDGPQAEQVRRALFAHRARRPRPRRDEKVLAAWNGLAVTAFARAGRILAEPRYTQAAAQAAGFVLSAMAAPGGGLWRRYRDGRAGIAGTLGDYACMAVALVDLYEATLEPRWLGEAVRLARPALARFWEPEAAAFYLTEPGRPHLIQRPGDDGDAGTPSAQSLACTALLRLRPFVADAAFEEVPAAVLARQAETMRRHPRAMGSLLCALDRFCEPLEVVLALPAGGEPPPRWLEPLRRHHLANLSLSRVAPAVPGLEGTPPVWRDRGPVDGRPTLWVCRGRTCLPPAHEWAEVEADVLAGQEAGPAGAP